MMKLVKIEKDNWEQLVELTSNADGIPTLEERFITSNAYSLLQAFYEPAWHAWGIEVQGILLGFAMYGRNPDLGGTEICRFMIDYRYQGRGYGRQGMTLLLAKLAGEKIYISAEPDNVRALQLYRSLGFQDTGRFLEGEVLLCRNPLK